MTEQLFIGVDVAKDWVDIHHPGRKPCRVDSAPAALRAFAARCKKDGAWVIFEASGGYDRGLRDALEAADVPFYPGESASSARLRPCHGRPQQDGPCRCSDAGRVRRQAHT